MKKLDGVRKEIENLIYHPESMGCGLEDREITDRYEACEYGWNEAIEAVMEVINNYEDTVKEIINNYEDTVKKEPGVTKEFLQQCKQVAKKYEKNYNGWIPVEKYGLPKSNEHDFRYWVTIQYANEFRRTIKAKWNWFDNCFVLQNGKKILQDVIAYKYYSAPEPYSPERSDNHDG